MFINACSIKNFKKKRDKAFSFLGGLMSSTQSDFVLQNYDGLNKAQNKFAAFFRSQNMTAFRRGFYQKDGESLNFTKKIGLDHALGKEMQSLMKEYNYDYQDKGAEFAQEKLSLSLSAEDKGYDSTYIDFVTGYISYAYDGLNTFRNIDFGTQALNELIVDGVNKVFDTPITDNAGWVLFNEFYSLGSVREPNILDFVKHFGFRTAQKLRGELPVFSATMEELFGAPTDNSGFMNARSQKAIANFIGEDPTKTKSYFKRLFDKYLLFNVFAQLTQKSILGAGSLLLYSISSVTESFINMSTYRKRGYSNATLDQSLEAIGETAGTLENFRSDGPFFEDTTGRKEGRWGRAMSQPWFASLMTGVQNFLGDALFRSRYKRLSMAQAMQNLGMSSTDTIEDYIYYYDQEGNRQLCESCKDVLTQEYKRVFMDYIGAGYLEGGSNTTYGKALGLYQMLTQWGTRYTQNTINRLTAGRLRIDKGVALENGYNITGEDIARDMISSQEVISEWLKLARAMKRMIRFNNIYGGCETDDFQCMMTRYLGVVYLPFTSGQIGHPAIQAALKTFWEVGFNDNPAIPNEKEGFMSNELMVSFAYNFIKPLNRLFYLASLTADGTKRLVTSDDSMLEILVDTLADNTSGMLRYMSEDQDSYLTPYGAYTPKSLEGNEEMIFGIEDNIMRGILNVVTPANRLLNYNTSLSDETFKSLSPLEQLGATKIGKILSNLNFVRNILTGDFDSPVNKIIEFIDTDPGMIKMSKGEIPTDGTDFFYNHFYDALVKNHRMFYGEYNDKGVRTSEYNEDEYQYMEGQLIAAINEQEKLGLSREDAIMQGLSQTLPSDTYQKVKELIVQAGDSNAKQNQTIIDTLAHIQFNTNVSGVMVLGLVAEAEKSRLVQSLGYFNMNKVPNSKKKEVENAINKKIVNDYGLLLFYADRAQWTEEMKGYAIEKSPDIMKYAKTEETDAADKAGDKTSKEASFKKSGVKVDDIIDAKLLSITEMQSGNPDGYYIHNNIMSKIKMPTDSKDEKGIARVVNFTSWLWEYMTDKGIPEQTKVNAIAPTISANTNMLNTMLQSGKLTGLIGQKNVDYFNNMMYKSFHTIKEMPEALDRYKDIKTIMKDYGESSGGKKYASNSYYSKYPTTDYNKYKATYPSILKRGALNYNGLKNGYAQGNTYPGRTNYTSGENQYLQQRAYRNSLVSDRIAIDIQSGGGQFSRKTVNVRIPVKPVKPETNVVKKGFAKFGENKTVVREFKLGGQDDNKGTSRRVSKRKKS